jgi:hypothetical protein
MTDVHEVVTARIAELRNEFAAGEARLARLEAEQTTLRETLLRIDGALLALNELLPVTAQAAAAPAASANASSSAAVAGGSGGSPYVAA